MILSDSSDEEEPAAVKKVAKTTAKDHQNDDNDFKTEVSSTGIFFAKIVQDWYQYR
jgi:hypothetical protein